MFGVSKKTKAKEKGIPKNWKQTKNELNHIDIITTQRR